MLPLILLYSIYTCKVLGAAMIYAKVAESTIVYTGDYNMTPDRHLGAAHIDRLQLDLLITEYGAYTILCKLITSALSLLANAFNLSYGTLLKELMEKMCRMFWKKAVSIEGGRKKKREKKKREKNTWSPLHPRDPSHAGGFFSPREAKKSLRAWGEGTRRLFNIVLVFCDHTVCPFDRSLINAPGPCVLFATPGMISGGFSLEVFKQWAPSELNLVTLPGYNYITISLRSQWNPSKGRSKFMSSLSFMALLIYCVAGTIGHKLMSGKPTRIDLDKDTYVDVRCQVLMQC
ncbi:hypothetical protein B296_00007000 [Ensete ventricosum]|uniref:Beta-Casp domain-containing protein n=1 Tax=Ensete ventricosum TaxID=4639 RepID=A0A427B5B4_ENSVE|nr:hypothetical protein B296_00007000 [Ensete ventricosum]